MVFEEAATGPEKKEAQKIPKDMLLRASFYQFSY